LMIGVELVKDRETKEPAQALRDDVVHGMFQIPLGTTANKQGRIAGENAAGGHAHFDGIVGTAVVKLFDLEVARTGLTEAEASRFGSVAESVRIQQHAIGHYMSGNTPLHVKLIWEQGTGRLSGAQRNGLTRTRRCSTHTARWTTWRGSTCRTRRRTRPYGTRC
jgi:NADPH-dependent 2,4-dienoyl-CoA reductase/sulfur reductase-like enzyme